MPFRSYPRKGTPPSSGELFPVRGDKPPQHHLVAHVDGGARGNPGPAGYGVLIRDEAGRRVAELSEYLGRQTNNYAEYRGLLAALRYAVEEGVTGLRVFSDSELLVRQIVGIYRVQNPGLRPLYEEAQQLIRKLDWFTIEHVRREQNREADRLANRAMDQGMGKPCAP
jgi:ribonuclease HI